MPLHTRTRSRRQASNGRCRDVDRDSAQGADLGKNVLFGEKITWKRSWRCHETLIYFRCSCVALIAAGEAERGGAPEHGGADKESCCTERA